MATIEALIGKSYLLGEHRMTSWGEITRGLGRRETRLACACIGEMKRAVAARSVTHELHG